MRTRSYRLLLALVLALIGLTQVRASVSIYMPPEHLARRAAIVVEGRVESTVSGVDPSTGIVSTYVTLAVHAVHRGPADLERVTLREAGGRSDGLVHVVDAAPVYTTGERVFVFLEPTSDGALRTTGMFYGKFRVEEDRPGGRLQAVRDLEGQGRLERSRRPERWSRRDLIAVTANVRSDRKALRARNGSPTSASRGDRTMTAKRWYESPPEIRRVRWHRSPPLPGQEMPTAKSTESTDFEFNLTEPVRWAESDTGTPVTVHVDPARNPLGDAAAAVEEIERAVAAWSHAAEARIVLQTGQTDLNFTTSHPYSPASVFSGTNVVLFGDPYDQIPDPVGCTGVLAIGGYWRETEASSTVNGIGFYPIRQLYVMFNDGFECFLGDPDNLAEVATHELGHGIGFPHSPAPDAIMRASAYGDRGPRLGDDDLDAAHCYYPHTLELLSPAGGDDLTAGTRVEIHWAATPESGPDPGQVDLELSTDGGETWQLVAAGVPNAGEYSWLVPDSATENAMLRVMRYHHGDAVPAEFPDACSGGRSDGEFRIRGSARTSAGESAVASRISAARSPRVDRTDHAPTPRNSGH